jgi:hypothetical protein
MRPLSLTRDSRWQAGIKRFMHRNVYPLRDAAAAIGGLDGELIYNCYND